MRGVTVMQRSDGALPGPVREPLLARPSEGRPSRARARPSHRRGLTHSCHSCHSCPGGATPRHAEPRRAPHYPFCDAKRSYTTRSAPQKLPEFVADAAGLTQCGGADPQTIERRCVRGHRPRRSGGLSWRRATSRQGAAIERDRTGSQYHLRLCLLAPAQVRCVGRHQRRRGRRGGGDRTIRRRGQRAGRWGRVGSRCRQGRRARTAGCLEGV